MIRFSIPYILYPIKQIFKIETPALAGTTKDETKRLLIAGDHPRSSGDYSSFSVTLNPCSGSLLLSRGLLDRLKVVFNFARITPALAGTTNKIISNLLLFKDHPRPRGDYFYNHGLLLWCKGSPPPSRGLPLYHITNPIFRRITPALAGTTLETFGREL